MAYEEKTAWIQAAVTLGAFAIYALLILDRAGGSPLVQTEYRGTMLWTIGLSIGASIVLGIISGIFSGKDGTVTDQRDRQVSRFGTRTAFYVLAASATATIALGFIEASHFWIANAAFLGLSLATILDSMTRIIAYRRGFNS